MTKSIKRALSFILCIIILICGSNVAYALSDENVLYNFEYPEEHPNQNFYNYPNLKNSAGPNVEKIEAVVDIDTFRKHLIDNFASCPNYVDIRDFKIPNTTENQDAIRSYIWYETPELFQVKGLGIGTSGGYITSVYANYFYTATEYEAMLKDFYKGAENLLTGIKGNANLSDVEKALLLHDRLAVWCEYDYANYVAGSIPRESYNAYGVLANKTAVCMGYALAYDYLLLQVGIDSYYCSSDALNHAWNIVYINGEKYHIDVTWDDPVYDRSGRVYHDNFLRSTTGITATGHDATDYDATPTDTTYDNYYWQSSNTAFQLIGNDVYYIDNTAETLNKVKNGVTTTCRSVSNYWQTDDGRFWMGNFALLSSDGENLLYTQPTAIYKYDVETGTSEIVYSPDLSVGDCYNIYGFKYENCKLICELYNTPNFELTTAKENTQIKEYHISSDWKVFQNTDIVSGRYKECIKCSARLEEEINNILSIVAKSGTTIDYENLLIFTDTFTCNDISQLLTVSGNTAVSVNDALSFYGTGTTFAVSETDTKICDFTIIVNGDVNGDSVCDVLDIAEAERFVTNKKTPDTAEIYAANSGVAENIDETTYQNLVNKVLKIEI